ncbi:MAG TPA: hypothetical protein PLR71_03945 [Deltaproteobacteria bacterium]|nr:hypothetical protein [Deltaproteobacteria bacterium]
MKSFWTVTVMALLFPLSLSAMTPMSDEDLSEVSGQTGVSIWVDITMNIHIDTIAWGDSDGLGAITYKSQGSCSSHYPVSVPIITVSTASMSPHMMELYRRYSSPGSVCFFPSAVNMDIVDGEVRLR